MLFDRTGGPLLSPHTVFNPLCRVPYNNHSLSSQQILASLFQTFPFQNFQLSNFLRGCFSVSSRVFFLRKRDDINYCIPDRGVTSDLLANASYSVWILNFMSNFSDIQWIWERKAAGILRKMLRLYSPLPQKLAPNRSRICTQTYCGLGRNEVTSVCRCSSQGPLHWRLG